jgi:hypothetical protein
MMVQDMDHMEASCVFYVKVGTFDQHEQSKIYVFTFTSLETDILTDHQHGMVRL